MTSILHINDNQLSIQQGDQFYHSQGYAWLKDDQVVFDLDDTLQAVNYCRLAPQQVISHYWQHCNTASIGDNGAGMRHMADLIWQHLSQMKKRFGLYELIFVVPSHYQEEQLQLLLGIAKACELDILGVVNKSVLAVQSAIANKSIDAETAYTHLDIQLHQTVCSTVTVHDGLIRLSDTDVNREVSIQSMQDALLKTIQASFISSDRFDPLHYAETEQQVFNQIDTACATINQNGKATISVEHQTHLHSVTLDSKQWNESLSRFTNKLSEYHSAGTPILVSLNNAFNEQSFNGLNASIAVIHSLDANTLVKESDRGESLSYQTELTLPPAPDNTQSKKSASRTSSQVKINSNNNNTISHVLVQGRAVAIEHAYIEFIQNQIKLSYQTTGNVTSLLEQQSLFVLDGSGRSAMSELHNNDRLGSNLADGVISLILVETPN